MEYEIQILIRPNLTITSVNYKLEFFQFLCYRKFYAMINLIKISALKVFTFSNFIIFLRFLFFSIENFPLYLVTIRGHSTPYGRNISYSLLIGTLTTTSVPSAVSQLVTSASNLTEVIPKCKQKLYA